MKRTTIFRELLAAEEILLLPGAHDALTAKIIFQSGFKAYTAGGYAATAGMLGAPDISQLSMTEMADFYARLCDASPLPILADADTGYGGPANVARTVRAYERAGVAALFIEDQVFPKRCGHMDGKRVVPRAEWLEKIKAALDSRMDLDLVVMARTDALAVIGIDEAIERAQEAREAGADLLFVEAPTSVEQMKRICSELDGPALANNVETGKTPALTAAELEAIGYAAVAYPVAATYAITAAVRELMQVLKKEGTTRGMAGRMVTFEEFNNTVGLAEIRARETACADFARSIVRKAK
jgi:2-methylisocitrate lyase-like PEP mutase family enzyme